MPRNITVFMLLFELTNGCQTPFIDQLARSKAACTFKRLKCETKCKVCPCFTAKLFPLRTVRPKRKFTNNSWIHATMPLSCTTNRSLIIQNLIIMNGIRGKVAKLNKIIKKNDVNFCH